MSTSSSNPLILDGQRIEKIKRNVTDGMLCMGLIFIFIGIIITFALYGFFSALVFFVCGICYLDCARMIRKDSYLAAIVALFIVSLQALSLLGFTLFAIISIGIRAATLRFPNDYIIVGVLGSFFVAFTVFSIAMAIEVRKVYRHLRSRQVDTSELRP